MTTTSEFTLAFDTEESHRIHRRALDLLRPFIAALAAEFPISIAGVIEESVMWLSNHPTCTCATTGFGTPRCLNGFRNSDRNDLISIPLQINRKHCGSILICTPVAVPAAISLIKIGVRQVIEQISTELENQALVRELSISWESLSAVYEITEFLNQQTLQPNQPPIFERIVDRAANLIGGLNVAFWLIEKPNFIAPIASKTTRILRKRTIGPGVIGRTITDRTSYVYFDRGQLQKEKDLEAEFSKAALAAIIPVLAGDTIHGVLAAWHEKANDEFDTRTLRLLETLATQAGMIIENERLQQEALKSEMLRQEVEIGHTIQKTLLFGQPPSYFPGLQISALTIASQLIDGDFYDFLVNSPTCLDFTIGDVMGKGIPAALVGAALKNQILRSIHQLVLRDKHQAVLPGLDEILTLVHDLIVPNLIELERFVTIHYGRFDLASQQFSFVDCGHTRTVHFRRETGTCHFLAGDNVPLGFLKHEVYETTTVSFQPGDIFCFYSDGITETRSQEGELFGEDRLAAIIQTQADFPPKVILRLVHHQLLSFAESETFGDDLTCVLIKIGEPASEGITKYQLTLDSNVTEIERVRNFTRGLCAHFSQEQCPETTQTHLEIAMVEAVVNVIRHVYQEIPGHQIQISATIEPVRLTVCIEYSGEWFDPDEVPEPEFDGSREGGFGLFIIRSCVDEFDLSPIPDGRVQMKLVKCF
ncbi:MAG TPA: SpoIIE family protein phosphatase [Acidobacteriota bacterium]|nr:SpoIIE family protein phosphatase [Acidobacteriota bacterium]HNG92455.1 SpoIIE family protein phosphatase [Acidobacteriota bacterium]